jgi:pyridoxamine 5'-phosphate oxidase
MSETDFDFALDPLVSLQKQILRAKNTGIQDANAMSLATADKYGLPSVRAVLFKGLVRDGLSFYTNYNSPKAQALVLNPRAALLFFWESLHTQIRISGTVDKTTRAESEAYFATRARLSQAGAWASDQSKEIPSFPYLEEKVDAIEKKYEGKTIPCPPHWGGFRLVPLKVEFWFGRAGRLHERYVFERTSAGSEWQRKLLSP